jgi:hypothetical protein
MKTILPILLALAAIPSIAFATVSGSLGYRYGNNIYQDYSALADHQILGEFRWKIEPQAAEPVRNLFELNLGFEAYLREAAASAVALGLVWEHRRISQDRFGSIGLSANLNWYPANPYLTGLVLSSPWLLRLDSAKASVYLPLKLSAALYPNPTNDLDTADLSFSPMLSWDPSTALTFEASLGIRGGLYLEKTAISSSYSDTGTPVSFFDLRPKARLDFHPLANLSLRATYEFRRSLSTRSGFETTGLFVTDYDGHFSHEAGAGLETLLWKRLLASASISWLDRTYDSRPAHNSAMLAISPLLRVREGILKGEVRLRYKLGRNVFLSAAYQSYLDDSNDALVAATNQSGSASVELRF